MTGAITNRQALVLDVGAAAFQGVVELGYVHAGLAKAVPYQNTTPLLTLIDKAHPGNGKTWSVAGGQGNIYLQQAFFVWKQMQFALLPNPLFTDQAGKKQNGWSIM